jgi:hypothetical protein
MEIFVASFVGEDSTGGAMTVLRLQTEDQPLVPEALVELTRQ